MSIYAGTGGGAMMKTKAARGSALLSSKIPEVCRTPKTGIIDIPGRETEREEIAYLGFIPLMSKTVPLSAGHNGAEKQPQTPQIITFTCGGEQCHHRCHAARGRDEHQHLVWHVRFLGRRC
jgi:hypothetical protein